MKRDSRCRILIADDHPIVRMGLAAMINHFDDLEVVGEAADGREAVARYRELRPDIVLMDLRMPETDGVEAIEQIRADFPRARIIVLTTYDGDEDIYRGIQAGAMGYLLKDSGGDALVRAIRTVHSGQRSIPPDVAAKLVEGMSEPRLTSREREVLQLIASGKTNAEIGHALSVSESTVKAHVNNVLTKLGANDRTQAVTTAIRRGILHIE